MSLMYCRAEPFRLAALHDLLYQLLQNIQHSPAFSLCVPIAYHYPRSRHRPTLLSILVDEGVGTTYRLSNRAYYHVFELLLPRRVKPRALSSLLLGTSAETTNKSISVGEEEQTPKLVLRTLFSKKQKDHFVNLDTIMKLHKCDGKPQSRQELNWIVPTPWIPVPRPRGIISQLFTNSTVSLDFLPHR